MDPGSPKSCPDTRPHTDTDRQASRHSDIRGMPFKRPLVPWRVFHVQKNMENFYPKGRRIIDPHLEGNLMHRGHREVALLDPDFLSVLLPLRTVSQTTSLVHTDRQTDRQTHTHTHTHTHKEAAASQSPPPMSERKIRGSSVSFPPP